LAKALGVGEANGFFTNTLPILSER
jgi:hypothetical protein